MEGAAADPSLRVMRYPSHIPLYQRLHQVIGTVETRYVILAADDDLYFFDWIDEAVAILERNPGFGVVYGHYCVFALDGFVPYGSDVSVFYPPLENPPFPFLEGETPRERIGEAARSPLGLATTGWYALQRAELLSTVLDYGVRHNLQPLLFEKFMIVAQAAATKTRMLDRLIIARQQEASADRPPAGLRGNEGNVEALRSCCVDYLHGVVGLTQAEAEELADTALEPELKLMRDADRKRYLRAAARYLPALRRFWRRMRPVPVGAASRDPHLPAIPALGAFRQEENSIAALVQGPPGYAHSAAGAGPA
jgi:hypothetical protein